MSKGIFFSLLSLNITLILTLQTVGQEKLTCPELIVSPSSSWRLTCLITFLSDL